jgi:hypothetical protein
MRDNGVCRARATRLRDRKAGIRQGRPGMTQDGHAAMQECPSMSIHLHKGGSQPQENFLITMPDRANGKHQKTAVRTRRSKNRPRNEMLKQKRQYASNRGLFVVVNLRKNKTFFVEFVFKLFDMSSDVKHVFLCAMIFHALTGHPSLRNANIFHARPCVMVFIPYRLLPSMAASAS